MNKIIRLVMCFLLVLSPINLLAQEEEQEEIPEDQGEEMLVPYPTHVWGDMTFTMNLGLFVPLFFQYVHNGTLTDTNLSVGPMGSLGWDIYLNNNVTLGIDLDGMFAFSPNYNMLFMVPITFKSTYIFYAYPFEFPIYLGTGICVVSYRDDYHVDFMLKPGFSTHLRLDVQWTIGLNFTYWWVLQIASEKQEKFIPNQSMMGNFLEVSFCTIYHF